MRRTVVLGAALLTMSAALIAQVQSAKSKAEAIIDRSVKQTGGDAWQKVTSMTYVGTVSLPAQSIKGDFEVKSKSTGKFLMKQKIASVGETLQGFDGSQGWAKDPFSGKRMLTGGELDALKSQAVLALRPARWREVYSGVELLGTVKVAGEPAYRIRLKPKHGEPETHYYSVKSGLEVRIDAIAVTQQGKIPVESYSSDYRSVGGVKIPFKLRQVFNQNELVMTISKVDANTPVDDAEFAPPK